MPKTTEGPNLSEFYKLSSPKKPPCQIRLILDGQLGTGLKPDEVVQLAAACQADKNIVTGSAIVEWLKARGIETNVNRVSNHRRGVCDCDG